MHRYTLVLAFFLGACWEYAGANTQESVRGNTDQGNLVGQQLIVGRDGRHLIASGPGGEGVFAVDLHSFTSTELDLRIDAGRMAFADGDSAYFSSTNPFAQDEDARGLVEKVSLATGRRLDRWSIPVDMSFMTYDERGDRLAFWSIFRDDLYVLDPKRDTVKTIRMDRQLVDLRWLPSGELAVVEDEEWLDGTPETRVTLFDAGWQERRFSVPNCASRLVVSPVTDVALLAPIDCIDPATLVGKDPVSVIDLRTGRFIENLPGFGPVAFSPDGETAVAFGRKADLATFGIETETPFSLLFISMRDLSIETLDIGDSLPLYSLTPDGQVVLVYSIFESASYDGIYLIDVATRTIRETSGPEVPLNEFVVTPDSRLVYLIEGGLFRLDVKTGRIEYVTIECGGVGEPSRCNPELVNMLPDGDTLVLGWRFDPEYALFDIAQDRVMRTFVVGRPPSDSPPLAN